MADRSDCASCPTLENRIRIAYLRISEASLAVFLLQDVFLTGGQQAEPFGRRTGRPFRPVEAVHQVAADFVLLQQHGDRLSRVDDG